MSRSSLPVGTHSVCTEPPISPNAPRPPELKATLSFTPSLAPFEARAAR